MRGDSSYRQKKLGFAIISYRGIAAFLAHVRNKHRIINDRIENYGSYIVLISK